MSLPKNARSITVKGRQYKWLVEKNSNIAQVNVLIQDSSGSGRKLSTSFAPILGWEECPESDSGYRLVQKSSVTPADIASTIETALDNGWNPSGKKISHNHKRKYEENILEYTHWDTGDPLASFTACLNRYGKPHPDWLDKYSSNGLDPFYNIWQITKDPGVMFEVLFNANRGKEMAAVLEYFAFKKGIVGKLFKLDTSKFFNNGQAIDSYYFKNLNNEDKLKSIFSDMKELADEIRSKPDFDYMRAELIYITDLGSYGDHETFCRVTGNIIREAVPNPLTLKEVMDSWLHY